MLLLQATLQWKKRHSERWINKRRCHRIWKLITGWQTKLDCSALLRTRDAGMQMNIYRWRRILGDLQTQTQRGGVIIFITSPLVWIESQMPRFQLIKLLNSRAFWFATQWIESNLGNWEGRGEKRGDEFKCFGVNHLSYLGQTALLPWCHYGVAKATERVSTTVMGCCHGNPSCCCEDCGGILPRKEITCAHTS